MHRTLAAHAACDPQLLAAKGLQVAFFVLKIKRETGHQNMMTKDLIVGFAIKGMCQA